MKKDIKPVVRENNLRKHMEYLRDRIKNLEQENVSLKQEIERIKFTKKIWLN